MNQINILLVDDHLLVRNGLRSLLESEPNFTVVGEGTNGQEGVDLTLELNPDILIIDVRMPIMNGIEAVAKLTETGTATRSIILSMHDSEEYILKAISAGASGYLLKDTNKDEFVKAITSVHNGGKYFSGDTTDAIVKSLINGVGSQPSKPSPMQANTAVSKLTKKESEILEFILNGFTNLEIAEKLGKSKRTIETHRFNLMKKLDVKNLVELSKKAQELGFL
ncbi:DNA-binding NarL/FixJ family response regulator [Wenyingzhuangia heitensis]|uniref:DNA-binding NarL/FixJ family response regulator n=1 Tax=Wenyingzhuangia heitensis TaxID=1487859 RepID=A0ABX0U6G9_9FLAO|nr:response regulator transcription factor [Wenyingzhuangia heitensis]NIJ43773.1 DNA-binding NarL/FixJ family response regulator [Wenyingzhuangia heitensis]